MHIVHQHAVDILRRSSVTLSLLSQQGMEALNRRLNNIYRNGTNHDGGRSGTGTVAQTMYRVYRMMLHGKFRSTTAADKACDAVWMVPKSADTVDDVTDAEVAKYRGEVRAGVAAAAHGLMVRRAVKARTNAEGMAKAKAAKAKRMSTSDLMEHVPAISKKKGRLQILPDRVPGELKRDAGKLE